MRGLRACAAAYAAMEGQLEALGVRWTTVCRWMEERGAALGEAAARWHGFADRLAAFTGWLADTEDVLGDIEKRWTRDAVSAPATTAHDETTAATEVLDVVEQVQCLKVVIVITVHTHTHTRLTALCPGLSG